MNCSVRVMTRPVPGTWPRVAVLVIILVLAATTVRAGYQPLDVIIFFLVTGLAGARVAQAMFPVTTGSALR